MPLGDVEVQITKVITVSAGAVSDDHNPTPNWVYGGPWPNTAGWSLRIEAEAGREIGSSGWPYNLLIHAMCLSRPVQEFLTPSLLPAGYPVNGFAETFAATSGWHRDPAEGTFKKDWTYNLPSGPLFAGVHPNHTYQYVVSLIETNVNGTGLCRVAVTAVSDPFLLI